MSGTIKRREFLHRSLIGGIGASALTFGNPLTTEGQSRKSGEPFQGIFPIMQTPFQDDDEIDVDVILKEVNFIIEAGGHGMAWPQLGSEFYVLTDEERLKISELIVKESRGRIPVIIGVQTTNYWKTALKFAKHAESIGADGIISLPPYQSNPTVETISEYYKILARTVSLPIFIQNSGGRYGPAMPIDMMVTMAKEYPNISYIKEEADPVFERIAELVEKGKGVVKGVFSGAGGVNLLEEMRHGSNGSCPGTAFVDIFAEIFENFLAGEKEKAEKMFNILLPMLKYNKINWYVKEKEILRRRGIFKNTISRVAPYKLVLNKAVKEEFDVLFNSLKPYFKV